VKRFDTLFRWFNVILILTTLPSYLSPNVNPEFTWVFSVFGLFFPWFMLLNLLMVLFWLYRRKWYLLFSLCCIILGWNHLTAFLGIHFFETKPEQSELRLLTFNIQGLSAFEGKHAKLPKEQLVDFFEGMNCDIICLQEYQVWEKLGLDFAKMIKNQTGLQYLQKESKKALAIFSKYPIKHTGILPFGNSSNGCIYSEVQIDGKVVRIYNVHLQSNMVSGIAQHVLDDGDIQDKQTWLNIRHMFGRFKRTVRIRAQQAKEILNHMQSAETPIILCGDLNDTPQSYTYQLLTNQLDDGFKKKGTGFATTYQGGIPALRIDYILNDPTFKVIDYKKIKNKYSDHFAVVSELRIK
jgi:endonuclease/exonuclease/phosphatase family metal-dependent hydrolase